MNSAVRFLCSFSRIAIRVFPLIVAACVLAFPAYKNVWLGYVPVFAGACMAAVMAVMHRRFIQHSRSWSQGAERLVLYALPAMTQVVMLIVMRPMASYDGLFVIQHARALAAFGHMDPMTYYPPAQTWWYAAWFAAFGSSDLVAQLSQIPLSIGVTWSVLQLGRRLTDVGRARFAALLIAWYPSCLGYVLTSPYYHYLYTLLTILMVWAIAGREFQSDSKSDARRFFVAGLLAGLGALTKATQMIAPLQVMVWVVLASAAIGYRPTFRSAVGSIAVFCVGMLLIIGPWTARNWRVFGDFVPVCTSGGLVLYSANNPDSNGLYSGTPDDVSLETPAQMLAHSRQCSDRAKQFIREHPGRFLDLAWRKFLHTWGVEATFADLINRRGESNAILDKAFSFFFAAGWAGLVLAWAWSSARRFREPTDAFEMLAGVVIISNAAVYVIFEGGDRHHLPLVPLIALLVIVYASRHTGGTPGGDSGRG